MRPGDGYPPPGSVRHRGVSRRQLLGRAAALGAGVVGVSQLRGLVRAGSARASGLFQRPLIIPPVLTDQNVTITAAPTDIQILPGVSTRMWTYNGSFPGPTIRRPSGQPSTLTLVHQLPDAGQLTLHHHGNHSSPENDGQPRPEVMVAPGTQRTYSYTMLEGGYPACAGRELPNRSRSAAEPDR